MKKKKLKPEASSKGERRRRQIIESATELFYTNGFDKTSMQDIADAVGLKKASLYYHFPGKDELLYTILDNFLDRLCRSYKDTASGELTPAERMHAVIAAQLKAHMSMARETAIFLRDVDTLPPEFKKRIQEKEKEYLALLTKDVRGFFRDIGSRGLDPNVLSHALFALGGTLRPMSGRQAKNSISAVNDLAKFFMGGLMYSKKGARRKGDKT